MDIRGSIQGACGGKGKLDGEDGALSGAAKGTGYGASAGEEGGWPRTVTEGNREAGDGQGAVGGRRRAQAGLGVRAGSVAPRLSSETRIFEAGKGFAPTGEGTPQGGIISPLLLNIALHGLEEAAGVRYHTGNYSGTVRPGCPALTRYADNLVVCCHSRQQAEQVKAQLAGWLEPRGLAFNDAKTRIVPLSEGFDFLGFNLRRYPNGKLLIKPGAKAIKRLRERLAKEFHALRGSNVAAVLATITPVIRGWVAYYRTVVSSSVFHALTGYLWKLAYKWACWSHRNKPRCWIAGRYFGKFDKFRNDRWVFGDRDTGAYLPKPAWTDIVRHTLVKGGPSPDDPALAGYWAHRRQKEKPPLDSYTVRLLSRQDGQCSLCGENLLTPDQPPQSPQGWERWFLQVIRRAITADYLVHRDTPSAARSQRTHLVHATCHRSGHPPRPAGNTVVQQNT